MGTNSIRGWMNEHELAWLAEQAKKARLIIEVGSAFGRSTSALCNPSGIVIAVDTWNGSPSELQTNHADYAKREGDFAFFEFCQNNFWQIFYGNIVPLRMHSLNAAALLLSHKLRADLIFIDANHDYEAVKADILAYIPLLGSDGTICGHDYGDDLHWPGVKKAVDEILPDIVVPHNTKIWCTQ